MEMLEIEEYEYRRGEGARDNRNLLMVLAERGQDENSSERKKLKIYGCVFYQLR